MASRNRPITSRSAVLFQIPRMSSEYRIETTIPQISSGVTPGTWFPINANKISSKYREARPSRNSNSEDVKGLRSEQKSSHGAI